MATLKRRIGLSSSFLAVLLVIGAGLTAVLPGNRVAADEVGPSANIRDYVANRLDDFTADIHLLDYNANAARHINKDFGRIYEWMQKAHDDFLLRFKEPDQLRIDGRFGAQKGSWIVSGTQQTVRVFGIVSRMQLGNTPGKRKSLLDMGLISNDYLTYAQAQYINNRPYQGVMCAVFKITYRDSNIDSSHRIVWIDPKTKVTLKREEYSQGGKLLSIWYYHDPHEVAPGIYMPASIEVDDSDGKLAGATAYRNVKVNQSLPDNLFQ